MITAEELKLVRESLEIATGYGAESCRITYSRNNEDMVTVLNGQVDKITSCQDRALTFYVFTRGRFGSFSTNKTDRESVESLVRKSIPMIQMLSADEFRKLPDPGRCCHNAVKGDELGLMDESYALQDGKRRMDRALALCLKPDGAARDFKVISEESEYSDSLYESITVDTNGLECRHSETSFDYWVEVTVEDSSGGKYSGCAWTSSPFLSSFAAGSCAAEARDKAAAQIGSAPIAGGRYNMVVSNEVSAKFVSPLLNALNGYNLQQHNSFLENSLGKRVFPEGLTVLDVPHRIGEGGSKLFDEEGVATAERPIIENGAVKTYFLNTYMSGKTGMAPTAEDAVRPFLQPWPERDAGKERILRMIGSGIYVTDFNGGNFNTATGDFSYGIEGFYFEDGVLRQPVSGMLVTGNLLSLWSSFLAAGCDVRKHCVKLIPTLAFGNVDFNGMD